MKIKKISSIILILLLAVLLVTPSSASAKEREKVWVGGTIIGIELEIDGVAVVKESKNGQIKSGDVIKKVEDKLVKNLADLRSALKTDKEEVNVKLERDGKILSLNCPLESKNGVKTLGILAREDVRGVGTLTFTKENGDFGALGHQVSGNKAKSPTAISGGRVSSALVLGVEKGEKNKAGELKAVFVDGNIKGSVDKNLTTGIYGKLEGVYKSEIYPQPVEIASAEEIKLGKATVISCVDGKKSEEYEIEIVTKSNSKCDEKGLVVKITDERLLQRTGGIVQGMSGSPIMQDGKLIGAITHVFLNDCARGFGIFIENMIDN